MTLQGLGTLLASTPFLIFVYGARLRARSPFAKELAKREEEDRVRRDAAHNSSSRDTSRTRAGALTREVDEEKEKDIA